MACSVSASFTLGGRVGAYSGLADGSLRLVKLSPNRELTGSSGDLRACRRVASSRPLDKKWASRPLGSREQALGEVNDGESGQQGKNQTDSQRGYLTV
jgi:hypothetical protein